MNSTNHTTALKVFLVEDAPGIRVRIADMLTGLGGVDLVGHAETPAEATSGILTNEPNAVVLDLQLRDGSGLEVLKSVHPKRPNIVFIVLTNHSTPAYERQCKQYGASHFIDKSLHFEDVTQIVAAMRDDRRCN